MKQTKIVASISDRRCDVDFIRQLFFAGMNVVRMNTAHATPDGIRTIIKNVRTVSPHIALMIDTKGPEVRTTGVDQPIEYKTGDVVKIFGRPDMDSSHDIVNLSYPDIAKDVKVGDDILFDDGELDMKVMDIEGPTVVAQVQNDGVLGAHKSVNVPGEHIALPALTEKDYQNILLAIDEDIDFIAHSFVRSADDVLAIQKILDEHNSDIKIISKIENQEGVDNIDEIIDASYGVMIARGDLGIEVPIERIPGIQRQIIRKCVMKKKPVIVATQMLHTMIKNPRPTRAEVTDIANAIYSYTDALMLSGETAAGKYPVQAVETMAAIAAETEQHIHYETRFRNTKFQIRNLLDAISHATCGMAIDIGAKAIVVSSLSGRTVRMVSRFRVPTDIVGMATSKAVWYKLALSWGVQPVLCEHFESTDVLFYHARKAAKQALHLQPGDNIVLTGGTVNGTSGNTNLIRVDTI